MLKKFRPFQVQLHQVPEQVAQFEADLWHQSPDIQELASLHQAWPSKPQPHCVRAQVFPEVVVVEVVAVEVVTL